MPIKGFNSVEEHNKEKIYEMFGIPSKRNPNLKVLPPRTPIPYICDETGKLFYRVWCNFYEDLHKRRYFTDKRYFSHEEEEFLKNNYDLHGFKFCAQKLNRDYHSVKGKISRLGLKRTKRCVPEGNKYCSRCRKILDKSFFYKSSRTKDGYRPWCKKCQFKIHITSKEMIQNSSEEIKKTYCINRLFHRSRNRAKRKGLTFNLTIDWIRENMLNFCPVLGIKFTYLSPNQKDSSPSLDRIDNLLGYTTDNIIIVSTRANSIKRDANVDELCKIADFYKNLQNKKMGIII